MHRLNLGVETENTTANIAMRTHGRQTVSRQSTQTRVVELESD